MTPHKLSPVHAQRVVEARLGREPQDMLEAAVALEAWAGLRALDALAVSMLAMSWGMSYFRAARPAPQGHAFEVAGRGDTPVHAGV